MNSPTAATLGAAFVWNCRSFSLWQVHHQTFQTPSRGSGFQLIERNLFLIGEVGNLLLSQLELNK